MEERQLRPYQIDMLNSGRTCWWVDMRLGKTLAAIRLLSTSFHGGARCSFSSPGPVLVLAPSSALRSWCLELDREGEDYVLLSGSRKRRLDRVGDARWHLANKEAHRAIPELGDLRWQAVILDESASAIRNPKSWMTKWMFGREYIRRDKDKTITGRFPGSNLLQAPMRLCLAGRPDPQNEFAPYWLQHAWAAGGEWMGHSNYYTWLNQYFSRTPVGHFVRRASRPKILEAVARDAFVLRRKDLDYDVPKTFEVRGVEMPAKARKEYRRAEEEWVLRGRGTQWAVVRYQWLRQMAGGFIDRFETWSGKRKELEAVVDGELAGEKVVVCFHYNHELWAVREAYRKKGVRCAAIWGEMTLEERHAEIADFEREKGPRILLAQIKVIETGEDLSAADTIIFYSLPNSVLAWIQAQDRILGNLEKAGALIIVLETADTVDGGIYGVVSGKDRQSAGFMDQVRQKVEERYERQD